MGAPNGTDGAASYDVIVVGAGFAGLYMLHSLREAGWSARVLERGSGVGGTWYWNRYPGARCDAESVEYSYSFDEGLQQEWEWTERYARQPEIRRYLDHVADRFDLRRDIQLDTLVTAATFDEQANRWLVETEAGEWFSCTYCVMASGALSECKDPPFAGLDTFRGEWYQTSNWPEEGVDFSGKRVGAVGTGSTGIQAIPMIAQEAEHLHVFQRTPNFSIPARNQPLDPHYVQRIKEGYAEHRASSRHSPGGSALHTLDFGLPHYGVPPGPVDRSAREVPAEDLRHEYDRRWEYGGAAAMLFSYNDLMVNEESNATIADFVRDKIRSIVTDPETAEKLCPTDHPLGTKRICVDTDYYATYNRSNVELVDVRADPIAEIVPEGLRTESGAVYELDAIVFAIGFDALTGALLNIDIKGAGGRSLRDAWVDGPRTYLGLMVDGFPNLFTVTGPGSPSVLSNVVVSIEQHVEWITDCLGRLREDGLDRIETTAEAQAGWMAHVNEVANYTLYPKANSWYMGANIPGKPRQFLPYVGGVGAYRAVCDEVAREGYRGFVRSAHAAVVH